jgi:Fur family ferric uptake transcriptional regulator
MDQALLDRSRTLLRRVGARVTLARVQVLATLLAAEQALTHTEVQRRLDETASAVGFDRVTLYRVLEWLTDQGLAHRVASDDRVFRFSAQPDAHAGAHGHFKCLRCERMICLPAGDGLDGAARALLPPGYAGERVELTILGHCAECAAAGGAAHRSNEQH